MLPIAILAGGLATRLRPLTMTTPKSLIKINGEYFISHQLRLLKTQGITDVVMCVGFLGEQIQQIIGNGKNYDLNIRYSFDGNTLLGTAGALKKSIPLLGENFFVLYGDSYLPCFYQDIETEFFNKKSSALMTVFKNQGRWDKSNVEFRNGQILAYDKMLQTNRMQYIDYGLGVFNHNVFDLIPNDKPYDLAKIYQQLLAKNTLSAIEVFERFYEIGSQNGINEISQYISNKYIKENA